MDLASAHVLHHLILLGPVTQSGMGQNHSRRMDIWCIPDWRESEGLSEQVTLILDHILMILVEFSGTMNSYKIMSISKIS